MRELEGLPEELRERGGAKAFPKVFRSQAGFGLGRSFGKEPQTWSSVPQSPESDPIASCPDCGPMLELSEPITLLKTVIKAPYLTGVCRFFTFKDGFTGI